MKPREQRRAWRRDIRDRRNRTRRPAMRDAHYEIVQRDLTDEEKSGDRRPEPFRARIRAANVELTWSTETYTDRDGARGGIGQNACMHSPVHKASVYDDRVEVWLDNQELGARHTIPIRYVDERTPEPLQVHVAEEPPGD